MSSSLSLWPFDTPVADSREIAYRFLHLPGDKRPIISPGIYPESAGFKTCTVLSDEMAEAMTEYYEATQVLHKSKRYKTCTPGYLFAASVKLCRFPMSSFLNHVDRVCKRAAQKLGRNSMQYYRSGLATPHWLSDEHIWSGIDEGLRRGDKKAILMADAAFWLHAYEMHLKLASALRDERSAITPSAWQQISSLLSSTFETIVPSTQSRTKTHDPGYGSAHPSPSTSPTLPSSQWSNQDDRKDI